MATIFGVLLVYLIYNYSKPSKPSSETIGDTKVVNGIEYWNMGDLEDQDNWRHVGPAEYQYFINVYVENGEVTYSLSCIEDESAIYVEGFYERTLGQEKIKEMNLKYRK
jgi:hypothetical protein